MTAPDDILTPIMAAVRSHGQGSGLFERFEGHELKGGTVGGLSGEVFFTSLGPVPLDSGLAATSARLVLTVRASINMLREPLDQIELDLCTATAALMRLYSADYTLGGLIRNIDLLAQSGPAMGAVAGYYERDRQLYRFSAITLPMIINDVWPQIP